MYEYNFMAVLKPQYSVDYYKWLSLCKSYRAKSEICNSGNSELRCQTQKTIIESYEHRSQTISGNGPRFKKAETFQKKKISSTNNTSNISCFYKFCNYLRLYYYI